MRCQRRLLMRLVGVMVALMTVGDVLAAPPTASGRRVMTARQVLTLCERGIAGRHTVRVRGFYVQWQLIGYAPPGGARVGRGLLYEHRLSAQEEANPFTADVFVDSPREGGGRARKAAQPIPSNEFVTIRGHLSCFGPPYPGRLASPVVTVTSWHT